MIQRALATTFELTSERNIDEKSSEDKKVQEEANNLGKG
jgi:hypothetical protein